MKTKLILTLVTALGASAALAQDNPRPEPPPRPEAPGQPTPPPPGAARPDRPPGEPRGPDGGRRGEQRPDADRGPRYQSPGDRRPDGERRPESGDRRPEGRPDGERPPMKPTPFLGVMTAPVPPPVAAQIGLAEGFGLIVLEVVPGSPAATAGVQKFDVLKQLDDQQLTDPGQLAALVRSRGKDASVSLTLVRKGQEQKVAVKVGERMMPERRGDGAGPEAMRDFDRSRGQVEERMHRMQEQMQQRGKEMQERMQKFQERMQEWQKNPAGAAPEPPKFGDLAEPPSPGPRDLLREARPGGAPRVQVKQDDGTTTWNTAQAHILVRDGTGSIEVSSNNGARTVTAKDSDGKVIFTGPIDTAEQRKALPEEVRKKLEKIHARAESGATSEPSASAVASAESPEPPAEFREPEIQ